MKKEDDSSVSTAWLLSMLNIDQRTQVKNEDDHSVSTAWLLSKLNVMRELKWRMKMTVRCQLLGCSQS